jgi:beta-propeller repeat-containing protein
VGFVVGAYKADRPLVLDPVLVYSTYLGGSDRDFGYGIAVDRLGNAYVTGYALSSDFPTANALQAENAGSADAFVMKLNAAGSALVYSTYLGGSGEDAGIGIGVDAFGAAYVVGATASTDFPTANALQVEFAGFPYDGFVTKLNAAGSALVYSTYLGGSDADNVIGIALDSSGNAYVTGYTFSTDFPTRIPLQPANAGSYDAFMSKLNAAGSALVYSTYLGGNGEDVAYGIAVDGSRNAYVGGYTFSIDFPTRNPFQPENAGGADAFVTRLNAEGSGLVYSTYLGGSGFDSAAGIAVDASRHAYVTGDTSSTTFPTRNAFQPENAGFNDAFVTRLNAEGSGLVYSTYLGGSGGDVGRGVAVDGSGNAYVTGDTSSTTFPTRNAFQPENAGGADAFVTKLTTSTVGWSALVYSTYLGGNGLDLGRGIAVDASGNAYVTGETTSTNFPTRNPFQPENAGGSDAFVSKIGTPRATSPPD